jgi:hypothetical protein
MIEPQTLGAETLEKDTNGIDGKYIVLPDAF